MITCLHTSSETQGFNGLLLFFVKVFCLIQFRLVGLKYSSNDRTTYYAEEIGARSLPNIKLNSLNSFVHVASFRSMSSLSPIHDIHAAVILLFLNDWTCSIIPDDHALFLVHSSNAWKRFQSSANSLLEELHVAKMRASKSEEINVLSA